MWTTHQKFTDPESQLEKNNKIKNSITINLIIVEIENLKIIIESKNLCVNYDSIGLENTKSEIDIHNYRVSREVRIIRFADEAHNRVRPSPRLPLDYALCRIVKAIQFDQLALLTMGFDVP